MRLPLSLVERGVTTAPFRGCDVNGGLGRFAAMDPMDGVAQQLTGFGQGELLANAAAVGVDSIRSEGQLFCDLACRVAGADQLEDF